MAELIKHRGPVGAYSIKVVAPKVEATLVVDKESHEKMVRFIELNAKECMWYSRIERLNTTDPSQVAFLIYDILIPHQIVADKEVEADSGRLNELWASIRTERSLDASALNDLMKTATVWSHSHVDMPVNPSGQDDTQWAALIAAADQRNNGIPIAMTIMNKRGDYFTRVYDPINRTEYSNVDMVVRDTIDYTYIYEAVKTKIKVQEPKTVTPSSVKPGASSYPNASSPSQSTTPWVNTTKVTTSPNAIKSEDGDVTFRSGDSAVVLTWGDQKKIASPLSPAEMDKAKQAFDRATSTTDEEAGWFMA